MFIFADLLKIINQTTILFDSFEYSDKNTLSFTTVIRTNVTRTQFISTFIKSSISISLTSSISFETVRKRRESSSTASCFLSETCRTSKSKRRIHVNHRVTRISDKSTIDWFNWVTKVLTFIFITKWTSYNQNRIFFKAFNNFRHFRFFKSYFLSTFAYKSLSYLFECFLSLCFCINTAFHFAFETFTVRMISSAFSK